MKKKVLVTGGCGFIGSNFIKLIHDTTNWDIVNIDKQTYAGLGRNLEHMGLTVYKCSIDNLNEFSSGIRFWNADITDSVLMNHILKTERPDYVVHFAAESHVDNSLSGPTVFFQTNVVGTQILLHAAKEVGINKFLHVSTDEVYGSLSLDDTASIETDILKPRSPYAASKAAAEHAALSYYYSWGVPVVVTRASNNIGPYQHLEKLIPKFVTNLVDKKKVPLMWSKENPAQNVRDWLHVYDHCKAIKLVLESGIPGEIYNVGGMNCEKNNMEVTKELLRIFEYDETMIEFVNHRAGHDFRYAIDCSKLIRGLEFEHTHKDFAAVLKDTVKWYKENENWWRVLKND